MKWGVRRTPEELGHKPKGKSIRAKSGKSEDTLRLFYDLEESFDLKKAMDHRTDSQGIKSYSIPMYLGVREKRLFRTAWQNEKSVSLPKFVTAHIDDELEKELKK